MTLVDDAWSIALDATKADASKLVLVEVHGAEPAPPAAWAAPESQLRDARLGPGLERKLNSPEALTLHRVLIDVGRWSETSDLNLATVTALLVHELTHVAQWERWGYRVFALAALGDVAIGIEHGRTAASGEAYNRKPTEVDANAAATAVVTTRWPQLLSELRRGGHATLFSAARAGGTSSLPRRLVTFLADYPVAVAQATSPHDVADYLERCCPGSGMVWDQLSAARTSLS